MKITMNVANLKIVFEACKTFVSKEDTEPILQTVQMNFRDKICTAYALDGVKLITVSVPYSDGNVLERLNL
jgi:DNA polymerase III sliding clamp (beta) subunit (PCNA family)